MKIQTRKFVIKVQLPLPGCSSTGLKVSHYGCNKFQTVKRTRKEYCKNHNKQLFLVMIPLCNRQSRAVSTQKLSLNTKFELQISPNWTQKDQQRSHGQSLFLQTEIRCPQGLLNGLISWQGKM